MNLRQLCLIVVLTAFVAIISFPAVASAKIIRGNSESTSSTGQVMELTMTIDDTKTRLEMTHGACFLRASLPVPAPSDGGVAPSLRRDPE